MRIAAPAVVAFRILLGLLAILYFTLALAILGVRYLILPNIDDYRGAIERLAGEAVGAPVRIGAISADWYRLNPQLHMSEVQMLEPSGQPALQLPRVDALLSWRSLLALRPEVLRLQLWGARLELERDVQGQWRVAGHQVGDIGGDGRITDHPLARWLLRQRSIEIHDAELRWHDALHAAPPLVLSNVDAVLRYTLLGGTRFAIQASPPSAMGGRIEVRGELRRALLGRAIAGAPPWRGRLYAAVDRVDLAHWQPWLRPWAPAAQGGIAARAWLDYEDGAIARWAGDAALRHVALAAAGPWPALTLATATVHASGDARARIASADVDIAGGGLSLPGMFERPEVPVHSLTAEVGVAYPAHEPLTWRFARMRVDAGEAGARAQLRADGTWRNAGRSAAGVIDLEAHVERADAGAVGRFMPLVVGEGVRGWLRDGVSHGAIEDAEVRLAGDLHDFPFDTVPPAAGAFRIAGRLNGVTIDPAPHSEPRWPPFEDLHADLVIDRAALDAHVRTGVVRRGLPAPVAVNGTRVHIPALQDDAVLTAEGRAAGAADAFLAYVRNTPLARATGGALQAARASGRWEVPLKVVAPLTDIDGVQVQGSVVFAENTVRLAPGSPPFADLTGSVGFTDHSVAARDVRATFLGGPFSASGATDRKGGGNVSFTGRLQAGALRELWPVAGMRRLQGEAAYAGTVSIAEDGDAALNLTSDLAGLTLDLPAPLNKPAATPWPLRVSLSDGGGGQGRHLSARLGEVANLALEFAPAAAGREVAPTRGAVGVNRAAALPGEGFAIDIQAARFDLDAWRAVAAEFTTTAASPGEATTPATSASRPAPPIPGPIAVALTAGELTAMGNRLTDARISATQPADGSWRLDVSSRQTAGNLEWRDGDRGPGRIAARFTRLALSTEDAAAGASAQPASPAAQPDALPDIDLTVDDLRYGDLDLGRLRLSAANQDGGRRWQIRELVLDNPAARLQASGDWQLPPGKGAGERRTTIEAAWKIRDAGKLLARLGMPDVVAGGHGDASGTLTWTGAPYAHDLASLTGHVGIALDKGSFLNAPSSAGRLLGILSLQSLARTATFQSGNLFESGFAWDTIRSDVAVNNGVAEIASFRMNGPRATAVLSGTANLLAETQNLQAVIVPHVDASAAALLAGLAVNPVIGVGAFLTQWLLREPLAQALTYQYAITGTWSEPKVTRVQAPREESRAESETLF